MLSHLLTDQAETNLPEVQLQIVGWRTRHSLMNTHQGFNIYSPLSKCIIIMFTPPHDALV